MTNIFINLGECDLDIIAFTLISPALSKYRIDKIISIFFPTATCASICTVSRIYAVWTSSTRIRVHLPAIPPSTSTHCTRSYSVFVPF